MKIGTKSVLFGAHAFWLHPWFVAAAWTKLYGFPWHPALWLCFFVHDIGYWGKPNMDGEEGETHPITGAKIVRSIFGDQWGEFCLFHSRWFANKMGKSFSKLCVADKFSFTLVPSWLYLPMVKASGELEEFMNVDKDQSPHASATRGHTDAKAWKLSVNKYLLDWVAAHKDSSIDTWMNGAAVDKPSIGKVPGYLEGGYESDRYIVKKRVGDTDPQAKYMVFRYDGTDPHSYIGVIAYAASVHCENNQLCDDIMAAVAEELGISTVEVFIRYKEVILGVRRQQGLSLQDRIDKIRRNTYDKPGGYLERSRDSQADVDKDKDSV